MIHDHSSDSWPAVTAAVSEFYRTNLSKSCCSPIVRGALDHEKKWARAKPKSLADIQRERILRDGDEAFAPIKLKRTRYCETCG